jgi:hypothetical protein
MPFIEKVFAMLMQVSHAIGGVTKRQASMTLQKGNQK